MAASVYCETLSTFLKRMRRGRGRGCLLSPALCFIFLSCVYQQPRRVCERESTLVSWKPLFLFVIVILFVLLLSGTGGQKGGGGERELHYPTHHKGGGGGSGGGVHANRRGGLSITVACTHTHTPVKANSAQTLCQRLRSIFNQSTHPVVVEGGDAASTSLCRSWFSCHSSMLLAIFVFSLSVPVELQ